MAIVNLVRQLQDIMRKDAGINGDAQRIEQMVWVIFLKVYDAQEEDWELDDKEYTSIIPEPLRWRNWAHSKTEDGKKTASLTGEALLDFVNNKLFPVLKGRDYGEKPQKEDSKQVREEKEKKYIPGIKVNRETPRYKSIVYDVFSEVNQYMKDGGQLRQLIDKIDEIDLFDSEESHIFGNIYEGILKDLQAAGNAGEFYTPRAVTDFIIKMLAPQLGEVVGDFAMGTGGFLVSALNYMELQIKQSSDRDKWQNSIIGQEWKPFPYLLAVTNVLLHEIKNPQLFHMDSLGKSMSEYEEDGKVNVIAMNPPYGGATSSSTKLNFKAEYRSSETADLFMVLIMQRLAEDGRAGVIVPDGFLFGTDGAKLAIKRRLFKEFNLHTIIRLPGSVFSPYTSIATNILFFNNEKADGAPEGFNTAHTWVYRLDMPKGYINFSKTKPMLLSHFDEICNWWNNRVVLNDGEKAQCFKPEEIEASSYNLDLCKYPKEEEVILRPEELISSYLGKSEECYRQIKYTFDNLLRNINGDTKRIDYTKTYNNPWKELADISASLPDKLKRSILQEAVLGKFSTQDPNDEPANILLDQVREEKKKLVKAGVLKKRELEELPIKEDELFDIPINWTLCRLKTICRDFIVPQRDKPTEFTGDIPWCRIEDIEGKYLNRSLTNQNVSMDLIKKMNMHICPVGTVISACSASIGNQAIITHECCTNQTFIGIVCNDKALYNEYLYYFLMSQKDNLKKIGKGTTISYISRKKYEDYIIPLPPLAEQHRIVEKIETLFAEIDNMTINNNIKETDIEEKENK